MRAIATAAATAAAVGKWLYYLAVDYVTNWAQSFDVSRADTRWGPGKTE